MDKQIYISVYKVEQEALDAINKLYRQGFRRDQVSVLAHNEARFHTLYHERAVPMSQGDEHAADKLEAEVKHSADPVPVVPVATGVGFAGDHAGPPFVAAMPVGGLATLNLGSEALTEYERSLDAGDILVILQTDPGQEYRPDLPLILEEHETVQRQQL